MLLTNAPFTGTAALLLASAVLAVPTPAHAQVAGDVTVVFEIPSVDLDRFDGSNGISTPSINDAGQVAFLLDRRGTGTDGIPDGVYRGDASGTVPIALIGADVPVVDDPDADPALRREGTFRTLFSPTINASGAVLVDVFRIDSDAIGDDGYFVGDGSTLTPVFRDGQAPPDGNGTITFTRAPRFNDAGQVAFSGTLRNTAGGSGDGRGVFVGNSDGSGTLTTVVRPGRDAPVGPGTFRTATAFGFNDDGQVLIDAGLSGTSGGEDNDSGVFLGNVNTGVITELVRKGDPIPGDDGATFSGFVDGSLGDGGVIAYRVDIDPGGDNDEVRGLFRFENGSVTEILRAGDTPPITPGSTDSDVLARPSIEAVNAAGQVLVEAGIADDPEAFSSEQILFLDDGTSLTEVLRSGDAAPGGGSFNIFTRTALNDRGQIAFLATLDGTGGSEFDENLFLRDPDGSLTSIARVGDPFNGSTLTGLDFSGNGLNNRGQLAVDFDLFNGRSGVAIVTIPEPATLALLAAGLPLVLRRRR